MESQGEVSMLRCRKCRKGFMDSTCLHPITDADDSAATACNIWHVNVDTLPEWILTSVHQAHWTVGKLNCQSCGARLGGFNFISRAGCPCGQDISVHLSKSRVDRDHRCSLHAAVRQRRTRPEGERPQGRPGASPSKQDGSALGRDAPAGAPFCYAVAPHAADPGTQPAPPRSEATRRPIDGRAVPSPARSPPRRGAHRKRCRLEGEAASSDSAILCPTTTTSVEKFRTEVARTGTERAAPSSMVLCRTTRQLGTVAAGACDRRACCSAAPPERRSALQEQQQQSNAQGLVASAGPEEVSDSPMFLRGSTISDSIGERGEEEEAVQEEQEQEEQGEEVMVVWGSSPEPQAHLQPQPSSASPAPNRLSKKEKNRLKSQRRKQKRRERWINSQLELEQSVSGFVTDSEEEDREGYTCAVCLDVYYSPYSCHPCGHVFCEPCLRTLAKNRPANTPCPLCRTLITHTLFQKELNQTAKTFFPKVYHTRKTNFQRAGCAKWPLPNCRKRFRIFWGYQRQAVPGRRWQLAPAGFTLDALDLADMRGWLFDIDLVIIYIHSVNWILAFLLLCFLLYFFFS